MHRRFAFLFSLGSRERMESWTTKKLYLESTEAVLKQVDSTAQGITAAEAARRAEQYGPNKLAEAKKATLVQRFFAQLKDPMLLILLAAAGVSAITAYASGESFSEVFIILAVVLLMPFWVFYKKAKPKRPLKHCRI